MQNRKLFDLIILGVWLFIAVLVTVDYNIKINGFFSDSQSLVFQPNREIEVEKISLVGEKSIDITLKDKNKSRVVLFFPFKANKQKISDFVSVSSGQKFVFYDAKENGKKVADLKFLLKGKEVSIKECLESEP